MCGISSSAFKLYKICIFSQFPGGNEFRAPLLSIKVHFDNFFPCIPTFLEKLMTTVEGPSGNFGDCV